MEQKKVLIIAEAGVNHNGDCDTALRLVDAAVEAGADIVKFQSFKAEELASANAKKAKYQLETTDSTESQLDMLKRLELSESFHFELMDYCKHKNIKFLSTAFDLQSLRFLVDDLKLDLLKIPSGELTNSPLVLEYARSGKNLIVSTGMASLGEIETVLGVIAFGLIADKNAIPASQNFVEAYYSKEGQLAIRDKVTLLHCLTEYPAPYEDINLRAMDSMASAFQLPVGYSDHSLGTVISTSAVARGAVVIEKHFTLNKDMEGPDHKASLEPSELKELVHQIRVVESCLGSGVKGPQPSEQKNINIARKSLVANKPISNGEVFSADNVSVKRPGSGVSPHNYWSLMGKKACRDYSAGDLIVEPS